MNAVIEAINTSLSNLSTSLGKDGDAASNAEGASAFAHIAQLEADIASLTGGSGSVAQQIANAIAELDSEQEGGEYTKVKVTAVDGKITAVTVDETAILAELAKKADKVTTTITATSEVTGEIAKSITATELKAVNLSEIAQTMVDNDAKLENKISTSISGTVDGLNANVDSTGSEKVKVNVVEEKGKITSVTVNTAALDTAIDAKVAKTDFATTVGVEAGSKIPAGTNYAEGSVKEALASLDGVVEANKQAIAVLNGTEDGSVAKAVADAKAELLGDAAEEYNTLGKLEDKIQAVEGAAKSYSMVKLTEEEVAALGETNVKEAYKLVDEDSAQAGETIKLYKDSSLKDVSFADQKLTFTYILADGSEKSEDVDVSAFLHEQEIGDGLKVVDHVVSVKVAEGNESFLTIDANGVKLSGVQDAINTAAAIAKTTIAEETEGHVTVSGETQTDGSIKYTIGENDIASAQDLADHIADTDVHIQAGERDAWNAKVDAEVIKTVDIEIDTTLI